MPRIRPRVVTAAEAELSRVRVSTPPPRHLQSGSSPNLQPRAEQQDTYASKVIKYLPSEIVAAYLAMSGILESGGWISLHVAIVVALVLLAPLWTAIASKDSGEPIQWVQTILSPFALIVWIFAIGGPFEILWEGYDSSLGTVALVIFSLLAPFTEKVAAWWA